MGCVQSAASATDAHGRSSSKPSSSSREHSWRTTGIVALRDQNLRELPKKLFSQESDLPERVRNVDATNNRLTTIPREISLWCGITRLVLASNEIESLPETIGTLTRLKTLTLDGNRLREFPSSIGDLRALVTLSACDCELETLPTSVSRCAALTTVRIARNKGLRSSALDALAECERLEEIDASACALTVLPAALGRLKRLRALNVDDNLGVHTIPSEVFKSCESLSKLSAHGTSVRNVEYIDGYDVYVARAKERHGRIISGNSIIVNERRGLDYGFDHRA